MPPNGRRANSSVSGGAEDGESRIRVLVGVGTSPLMVVVQHTRIRLVHANRVRSLGLNLWDLRQTRSLTNEIGIF